MINHCQYDSVSWFHQALTYIPELLMLILRLSLFLLVRFYTCPGGWGWGWVGQIKINDHLSPIEIETRTELGKNFRTACLE